MPTPRRFPGFLNEAVASKILGGGITLATSHGLKTSSLVTIAEQILLAIYPEGT